MMNAKMSTSLSIRLERAPCLSCALACLLSWALAACGDGLQPASNAASSSPSLSVAVPAAVPTLKEQIADLEKRGELPLLDRSSDIAGPDKNSNGIRDDIDGFIAALPVDELVKKAARQVARVQQKSLLIDLRDRPALLALSDASMASTACMSSSILVGVPLELEAKTMRDGHAITLKIEAITANTPERAQRYLAYMGALHGTTTTYPTGKVCEDG